MATGDLIIAYKANIDTAIGNQTAPSSVNEDTIASAYKDLADIINGIVGGAIAADYDTLLKLATKITNIENLVGNGDPDGDSLVDTVAEILTVFVNWPEGTNLLTALTSKVETSAITNNLTTTTADLVLDARQGKVLLDMITPKAATTYVDTQDAALNTLITNLKAGSSETIASLKTALDLKAATTYVNTEIQTTKDIITALKNGSIETIASLANSISAINAIIGGTAPDGDAFVDTVAEILTIFSTYPEGVDLLGSINSRVLVSNIVNTLTEVTSGKVLDARQGKILKDLLDANTTAISNKQSLLVSGTNFRTVGGISLLGSGTDINVPVMGEDDKVLDVNLPDFELMDRVDSDVFKVVGSDPNTSILSLQGNMLDVAFKVGYGAITPVFASSAATFLNVTGPTYTGLAARNLDYTTWWGEQSRHAHATQVTANYASSIRVGATIFAIPMGFAIKGSFCPGAAGETISTNRAFFQGLVGTASPLGTAIVLNTYGNALIAIGFDALETNVSIFHNDASGTPVKIDLGANYPTNTNLTDAYEWSFWCTGVREVSYKVVRRNATTGVISHTATGSITTKLPLDSRTLAYHSYLANNTDAMVTTVETGVISWIRKNN